MSSVTRPTIVRPQGRNDDHRRNGDLRVRPDRPGPSTGEPQSGYLVGVDTPTAQEAALLQKLAEEFGDGSATMHTEDIVRQRREQQAD